MAEVPPQPAQTQVPVVTGKKISWSKILITIFVIIVITTIIAGGYWFFVLNKSEPSLTEPIKSPIAKESTPSTKPSTPSAKLKDVGLPFMKLRYKDTLYDGEIGSSCWVGTESSGETGTLCADYAFVNPSNVIPILANDKITIEIDAHENPITLTALIYSSTNKSLTESFKLEPSLSSGFIVDLPTGEYIIHTAGVWSEGDIYFGFKIKVS